MQEASLTWMLLVLGGLGLKGVSNNCTSHVEVGSRVQRSRVRMNGDY